MWVLAFAVDGSCDGVCEVRPTTARDLPLLADAVPLDAVRFDSWRPWILLLAGWSTAGCGGVRRATACGSTALAGCCAAGYSEVWLTMALDSALWLAGCDAGCGKVRFRYGPGYCFRLAGVPLGAVRLELCLVSADCGILQGWSFSYSLLWYGAYVLLLLVLPTLLFRMLIIILG